MNKDSEEINSEETQTLYEFFQEFYLDIYPLKRPLKLFIKQLTEFIDWFGLIKELINNPTKYEKGEEYEKDENEEYEKDEDEEYLKLYYKFLKKNNIDIIIKNLDLIINETNQNISLFGITVNNNDEIC